MSIEKIFTDPIGERKIAADIRQNLVMVEIMRDDKMTLAAIQLTISDAEEMVSYIQDMIANHTTKNRF